MTTSVPSAPAATPIAVVSQALGPVQVAPERAMRLLEPLAGFPDCRAYALVPHSRDGQESDSIHWLQALEAPFHAFIVTEPWGIFPDYAPELADADAAQLSLSEQEDARLLVILTVAGTPARLTANLRAPIVVNAVERTAKQVVLLGDAYHTRHDVKPGG